ncbi:hypothetical protein CJP74_03840 [Psittacicella melopsittaci]|uniref:CRM domain-containing protein n=1 Tax=Psittacicella melopsittaci TaxID=2028576 RepID=A0A3A1Y635_9GAMM|nr:YhbY family RNA-binding protein [Psittacicella melopsittaci]RIY32746.1 hypothetical protein CJP74_03840 [Psittacicella melopsittaci]
MALKLTTAVKKELFGLSHDLKPVVMIGQNLLTDAVIKEFNNSIDHHELIKVKMSFEGDTPEERKQIRQAICDEIVRQTQGVTLIRIVGNIAVFYKPSKAKKVEEKLKLFRAR